MLIKLQTLRERLEAVILNKKEQGYKIDGLIEQLDSLPNSYDKLIEFTNNLSNLQIRSDWKYNEPNDLHEIWSEAYNDRPLGEIGAIDINKCSKKIEAAFLGSICGCIL